MMIVFELTWRHAMAICMAGWLLVSADMAESAELAVAGYPAVADEDDLGLRSALVLFLQARHIPYQVTDDDAALLQLYRDYWDGQQRAKATARASPVEKSGDESRLQAVSARNEEIDRDNLALLLRRQYRYMATAGKTRDELRQILDDVRRNEQRTTAVTAGAQAPLPISGHASTTPAPAAAPAAVRPAAMTIETGDPIGVPGVPPMWLVPRNRDLPSMIALQAGLANGDLETRLGLARRYAYGLDTLQDESAARNELQRLNETIGGLEVLRNAAWRDDEIAQFGLGVVYRSGPKGSGSEDIHQAIDWFEKAAAHGSPQACGALSELLRHSNDGIPADPARATQLLHRAAEGGSLAAIESLACGAFQEPDGTERLRWQRIALATCGRRPYRSDPGLAMQMGAFVGQDHELLLRLYCLAARNGSVDAQFRTGMEFEGRKADQVADGMARFWLGAAALRGHHDAMLMLAQTLFRTRFDPTDPLVAYTWVARVCGGTKPYGPPWDDMAARLTSGQIESALADACTWQPIPERTPLNVPPERMLPEPPPFETWPLWLEPLKPAAPVK